VSSAAARDQQHDLVYKSAQAKTSAAAAAAQGSHGAYGSNGGGGGGGQTQGDASAVAQNVTNAPINQNPPPGVAPTARPGAGSSHAVETKRDAGVETNTGGRDGPTAASGEREH
jgi:hypothetical protein